MRVSLSWSIANIAARSFGSPPARMKHGGPAPQDRPAAFTHARVLGLHPRPYPHEPVLPTPVVTGHVTVCVAPAEFLTVSLTLNVPLLLKR
jgi:hypothetical protein